MTEVYSSRRTGNEQRPGACFHLNPIILGLQEVRSVLQYLASSFVVSHLQADGCVVSWSFDPSFEQIPPHAVWVHTSLRGTLVGPHLETGMTQWDLVQFASFTYKIKQSVEKLHNVFTFFLWLTLISFSDTEGYFKVSALLTLPGVDCQQRVVMWGSPHVCVKSVLASETIIHTEA